MALDSLRPLVSIITVTFNADRFLETSIKSVIEISSEVDIEYIIVDGNSTDQTGAIVDRYKKHIDIFISESDKGIYDAMNKGIRRSSGRWVLFLGADDSILPSFKDALDHIQDEFTIYYGDYISNSKRYGGRYSSYRLAKSNICQQAILYSRKVFSENSFNLEYPIAADWEFNMMVWKDSRFKFNYIPVILTSFSSNGISSLFRDDNFEDNKTCLVKRYLGKWVYVQLLFKIFRRESKQKLNTFLRNLYAMLHLKR